MLDTYFAKSLELRQTAIFADKLQDFSKDRRVCRQGAEFTDKNFFQGGCDAPHAPHPDGPGSSEVFFAKNCHVCYFKAIHSILSFNQSSPMKFLGIFLPEANEV